MKIPAWLCILLVAIAVLITSLVSRCPARYRIPSDCTLLEINQAEPLQLSNGKLLDYTSLKFGCMRKIEPSEIEQ